MGNYTYQDDELMRTQFMITVGHDNWLDEMSKLNNLSRSQIVRLAIEQLRKQPEVGLHLKYGRTQSGPMPGQANAYRAEQEPL